VAATGRKVPKRDGCHGGSSSGLANSSVERGDYHEKDFSSFCTDLRIHHWYARHDGHCAGRVIKKIFMFFALGFALFLAPMAFVHPPQSVR
jgi:hypothetical protein